MNRGAWWAIQFMGSQGVTQLNEHKHEWDSDMLVAMNVLWKVLYTVGLRLNNSRNISQGKIRVTGKIKASGHFVALVLYSCVRLFLWPHRLEFSRWEYWSELPFPSPGDLPNTWIKPALLASPLPHWQGDSWPVHHNIRRAFSEKVDYYSWRPQMVTYKKTSKQSPTDLSLSFFFSLKLLALFILHI